MSTRPVIVLLAHMSGENECRRGDEIIPQWVSSSEIGKIEHCKRCMVLLCRWPDHVPISHHQSPSCLPHRLTSPAGAHDFAGCSLRQVNKASEGFMTRPLAQALLKISEQQRQGLTAAAALVLSSEGICCCLLSSYTIALLLTIGARRDRYAQC